MTETDKDLEKYLISLQLLRYLNVKIHIGDYGCDAHIIPDKMPKEIWELLKSWGWSHYHEDNYIEYYHNGFTE